MLKKLVVVLVICAMPALAFAENDTELAGGKRYLVHACKKFHLALRRLELSETQREDIAAALAAYREDIGVRTEAIIGARRELFRVVYTPTDLPFDEALVREAFQALQELREENIVRHALLMIEFQSIMNAEQYRKFVRARIFLFRCLNAPDAIFRRHIDRFIDKNS